jgi:hypothetical protein
VPPLSAVPSVSEVLARLAIHPRERILRRWNWKSAALSAVIRASIFFASTLSAGWHAALGASGAELIFRAATSGFYGTIAEALAPARPLWKSTGTALVLLPATSQAMDFVLHAVRGTPALGRSFFISTVFTVVSTIFNLFVMRRGVLIVGDGRLPILCDLQRMPGLIGEFLLLLFPIVPRRPL